MSRITTTEELKEAFRRAEAEEEQRTAALEIDEIPEPEPKPRKKPGPKPKAEKEDKTKKRTRKTRALRNYPWVNIHSMLFENVIQKALFCGRIRTKLRSKI